MKAIIIFLCALSVYGCGDSVAKSKHVYRHSDPQLQFILGSISERLDQLEGLRGREKGIVPLSFMRRAYNTKTVNNQTIGSSLATLVSVEEVSLVTGDIIFVAGKYIGLKQGTAGTNAIVMRQTSGSASIQWNGDSRPEVFYGTSGIANTDVANVTGEDLGGLNSVVVASVFAIGEVITGGRATISIRARSDGSDTDTVIGSIAVLTLVGS